MTSLFNVGNYISMYTSGGILQPYSAFSYNNSKLQISVARRKQVALRQEWWA